MQYQVIAAKAREKLILSNMQQLNDTHRFAQAAEQGMFSLLMMERSGRDDCEIVREACKRLNTAGDMSIPYFTYVATYGDDTKVEVSAYWNDEFMKKKKGMTTP